jgi:23S rRNA pseudouridine1911/1915/1917 synthase
MNSKLSLVVYKPSGVSCFPLHGDPLHDCMLHRIQQLHPEQKQIGWPSGFSGGIAHRLDIPTSGQLIVARDLQGLHWIRTQFTEKKLCKTYYFLSIKKVRWSENTISIPIAHDRRKKNRMVVQRGRNTPHRGKWLFAETTFTKLKECNDVALWKAQMYTGVMHQIRIHAAFAGIALLGDRLYGGGESPEEWPSDFALHHHGLNGQEWNPVAQPIPDWWPDWVYTS